MSQLSRRQFLRIGSAALGAGLGLDLARLVVGDLPKGVPLGQRPQQDSSVRVLNPLDRIPASFIIDDSTCLVNMGAFCMPQFATAWPNRSNYNKPWKSWPREIPDAFLREFGQWCAEHGVRGKFSIVPYPCLVGWLDRELPGWSHADLQASLKLVRELIAPNWDIHPEMITHTRVIDIRTGRPFAEISSATMENSYPQTKKSVDELAAYIAYALRILKNCELPCEGITTPGGFGNKVKSELALAVYQAVQDVYGAELPHYFKYLSMSKEPAAIQPRPEHVKGLGTPTPQAVVNVPACTGDWFGGWDGDRQPEGHRYANEDASAGRMPELIELGGPAAMFCHWPGLFNNGRRAGFEQMKRVILAIEARYGDRIIWMKTSELARYWAARTLTAIARQGNIVTLNAPYACPRFTLEVHRRGSGPPQLHHEGKPIELREVHARRQIEPGTWLAEPGRLLLCFDLPKGLSTLAVA